MIPAVLDRVVSPPKASTAAAIALFQLAASVTSNRMKSASPPSALISATTPLAISSLRRSEEHTSELQSLMRISYAVFCLKKKKYSHTLTPILLLYHSSYY